MGPTLQDNASRLHLPECILLFPRDMGRGARQDQGDRLSQFEVLPVYAEIVHKEASLSLHDISTSTVLRH